MSVYSCPTITVQPGDSLNKIAEEHQVSIDTLIMLNPSINPDYIVPGQKLCIASSSFCPIGSIPYEIKAGETLSSIATLFATTDEALLKLNPHLNPYNLAVGDVLCIVDEIPKLPQCPSMNIYVIRRGDTLYDIATQFGTTVDELLSINPGLNLFNLEIDDIICLPLTPTPYIIVIDKRVRRLFLYYQGRYFKSYPVAIGKYHTPTPTGVFYIYNKQVQPGGPFGTRWLGLSIPSYGIHGTNRPASIGLATSNGCIRMQNEDVEELFSIISINTPVIIR